MLKRRKETVCGKDYVCLKDYHQGNCSYTKGYTYHCGRNGYLIDDNQISWSVSCKWFAEYMREKKEYMEEKEIEKREYVSGKFLECIADNNYGLKKGEKYWLEYLGEDTYIGRSDNALNKKFHITPKELYTILIPETQGKDTDNAPMAYGKLIDDRLNEAAKRYFSEGQDSYSLADVFYAGVMAGKEAQILSEKNKGQEGYMDVADSIDKSEETGKNKESICHDDFKLLYKIGDKVIVKYPKGNTGFLDNKTCTINNVDGTGYILEYNNGLLAQLPFTYQSLWEYVPKFNVGDWVVLSNSKIDTPFKIVKNDGKNYIFESINGETCSLSIRFADENLRLWSIKDAKNGDILYFDDDTIAIFKDLYNSSSFHSYCHIEDGKFSFAEGNPAKIISKGYKRILNTELERTVKDMFKISGERSIVVKYSDDCITLNGVSYKKLFER